jgi:hypothetical protein
MAPAFILWPSPSSGGAVEFDKIGGVELRVEMAVDPNNGPGLYRFESLVALPEPSGYAVVFALGLLGFGTLLRSRHS